MAEPEVISFRPSKRERQLIERTLQRMGLRSRADAVRFLVRQGAEAQAPTSRSPVFQLRAPKRYRLRRSLTPATIDDALYGGR